MPSVLNLYLTGLCEFVPRYDVGDPAHVGHNQMRVLMPETRQHRAHGMEEHVPVLVCSLGDVDRSPGNRTQDAAFVYQNRAFAIFYLVDQELRIDDAAPESLDVPSHGGGGNGCNALTTLNWSDFAWVARIETITPGAGQVQNACFDAVNPHPSVNARLALSKGTLETARIARDDGDQVMLWAFDQAQAVQQPIADVTKFWVNLAGDSVTFKTGLLRPTQDPRVLPLYPGGVGSPELPIVVLPQLDRITVYVASMPLPDVRHERIPPTGRRSPETHFVHFYDMSTTPGARNIPFQVSVCPGQTGPHQGNPSCPPAQGAANLLA